MQGVHPANILQASRKDVASIHTSLASCEHYDWSACLQRAYCMRVTFQKYACANTLRALMCACNTHAARLRLACCVLAARRLRAFFSARGMFAIFIRVYYFGGKSHTQQHSYIPAANKLDCKQLTYDNISTGTVTLLQISPLLLKL